MELNCGFKQAVLFLLTCFVILFLTQSTTLIANDDCEIEKEYIDSSNNKKKCVDENKEDLKSCIWQSSVYEIPLDTYNGCVNGEAGQITYDYVDMVTENKNLIIIFDDLFSALDTAQENLRVLPMASMLGQFTQSCWLGAWSKCCQYNVDGCYRFLMPHKLPEKNLKLELIQPSKKNDSSQNDTRKKASSVVTEEGEGSSLIKQLLPPTSLDFSYSPGLSNRLFSLDITLNPNGMFSQLSEDTMQDLTPLLILTNHPYLQNFYIRIGCEGTKPDSAIVFEFEPKDQSRLLNAQPLVEYFQGNEVLIPQCGKKLKILCANLDENQKLTITVTGELPPDLFPLIASFMSPIGTLCTEAFTFRKLQLLIFIISRYSAPLAYGIQGTILGAALVGWSFKRIPKLRNYFFVKNIREVSEAETSFHNRLFNKVNRVGKRTIKVTNLLLAWLGFNQLTGSVVSSLPKKPPPPIDTVGVLARTSWPWVYYLYSLGCFCKNEGVGEYGRCDRFSHSPSLLLRKNTLEKSICDNFCLGLRYTEERCQVARNALSIIFAPIEVSEKSSCYNEYNFYFPVEKPLVPTCLGKFAIQKCSVLRVKGIIDDVFCKLCNAAHDPSLWCQSLSSSQLLEVSDTASTTLSALPLLPTSVSSATSEIVIFSLPITPTSVSDATLSAVGFYPSIISTQVLDIAPKIIGSTPGLMSTLALGLSSKVIDSNTAFNAVKWSSGRGENENAAA